MTANEDYSVPIPLTPVQQKASLSQIFASEAIGMFVFIYGSISAVNYYVLSAGTGSVDTIAIALCFGLSLTAGIYMAKASGGHLNPSVSVAILCVDGSITFLETLVYLAGQGFGAIFAGLMVAAQYVSWINNYPNHKDNESLVGMYGTLKNPNVSLASAILDQFVGSFILMYAICTIPNSKCKPLLVGATLFALGMLMQTNGFAFNGWRDMGPRIASTTIFGDLPFTAADHWFWVPMVVPFPAMILAKYVSNYY
jgi:glycerol uptake facilitator-like aquaporin